MPQTIPHRSTERPWNAQPGRLNPSAATSSPRDRLRFAATQARLRSLQEDWLFQNASPAGRERLLREHGLLPR